MRLFADPVLPTRAVAMVAFTHTDAAPAFFPYRQMGVVAWGV